jgi:hypothetical protein
VRHRVDLRLGRRIELAAWPRRRSGDELPAEIQGADAGHDLTPGGSGTFGRRPSKITVGSGYLHQFSRDAT